MQQAKWTVEGFDLTSYGNGVCYLVTDAESGLEAFFQGDDADQFREEYEYAVEADCLKRFLADTISNHGRVNET